MSVMVRVGMTDWDFVMDNVDSKLLVTVSVKVSGADGVVVVEIFPVGVAGSDGVFVGIGVTVPELLGVSVGAGDTVREMLCETLDDVDGVGGGEMVALGDAEDDVDSDDVLEE